MKKFIITLCGLIIIVCAGLRIPVIANLWHLATGRGYVVPEESSIFTFTPLVMNEGSGEWWLYGEDRHRYYFIGEESDSSYRTISKSDAEKCPGFVITDYKTWCRGKGKKN